MKALTEIKKFEDIDTYYNILELVSEIFVDRVEAHKHLVSANKEIERLNNIIDELELYLKNNIKARYFYTFVLDKLKELKEGK